MLNNKHSHTKGFTLIELLVVIGIIALLASILSISMNGIFGLAKRTQCLAKMRTIATAFQNFSIARKGKIPPGTRAQTQIPRGSQRHGHRYSGWEDRPWIGKEVINENFKSYTESVNVHKTGALLPYMERSEDDEAGDIYLCPSLEFVEQGSGVGSNGGFDYAAPVCFYGATRNKIQTKCKYRDPESQKWSPTVTPLLVEEDPAMLMNKHFREPGHSHCDRVATTHNLRSNIAGIDGSAHSLIFTSPKGAQSGNFNGPTDWHIKTPKGRIPQEGFSVCGLPGDFGLWDYK